MGVAAIFIILFWTMCNIIVLTGTRKDAEKKYKNLYEEWLEGTDRATRVVMVIFFPLVSFVAYLTWKNQR